MKLLDICCSRLRKNGGIVLNAATIENLMGAVMHLKSEAFKYDITLAQISRSKPILNLTRFDAMNPIYIINAKERKMNEQIGTLYGVGVGPGDPELITVKAFRIKGVTCYCLSEKRKGSKSYAQRIIDVYIPPEEKEMLGLVFPMTKDQTFWKENGILVRKRFGNYLEKVRMLRL